MKIAPGCRLVMIGDSITDAGRSEGGEPTPWNAQQGLGHGYANLVFATLTSARPQDRIRVTNRGNSGNTVLDLKGRWDKDVLDLKPDWLSVMIGINDVWRQFDCPRATEGHVTLDKYETAYREILAAVRPQLKGLVLLKPYIIEPNREDPMRKMMDAYGDVTAKLAGEFDAILADPQAEFDRVTQHMHPMALAWDRIHPNTAGHMCIAKCFLKAVGFEG